MSKARSRTKKKPSPAVCRCCLGNIPEFLDGFIKDISAPYFYDGQQEVYADMLKDTFDVEISFQEGCGPSRHSRLICDDCILKLRDASVFKQKVLESEENILQHLESLKNGINSTDLEPSDTSRQTKCNSAAKVRKPQQEQSAEEESDSDEANDNIDNTEPDMSVEHDDETNVLTDVEKCEENDQSEDDAYHFEEVDAIEVEALDDEFLTSVKEEVPDSEPEDSPRETRAKKRAALDAASARAKRVKVERGDDDDDSRNRLKKKEWMKIVERRGNGPILRENSLKLLANSTICVFQWHKSRYRCFCCKEPFSDVNVLKDHTNTAHSLKEIEKVIITQQNRLVKVEISSLYCKICSKPQQDILSLRGHLAEIHDIEFGFSDEDLLVPFKLQTDTLQCQLCLEIFTVFRLLNIHMNKHFQKQVCHICGAGFSSLVFLNLHKTRNHRPLKCGLCDVEFGSRTDKREHDLNIHNVKLERKLRFPCPFCQERFFQENFRVQHLVEKHGMAKPEHKCNVCGKVYITKSLCNSHLKYVHMKERNSECDICHMRFYTKSDVNRHKVTHTGEKNFSCSLCNNLFATKDSLRRHIKRTHVNVN